jgi:hypothetical protein
LSRYRWKKLTLVSGPENPQTVQVWEAGRFWAGVKVGMVTGSGVA